MLTKLPSTRIQLFKYFINDTRLPVPDWAINDIDKLIFYDAYFQNQIMDYQNDTVGGKISI